MIAYDDNGNIVDDEYGSRAVEDTLSLNNLSTKELQDVLTELIDEMRPTLETVRQLRALVSEMRSASDDALRKGDGLHAPLPSTVSSMSLPLLSEASKAALLALPSFAGAARPSGAARSCELK